MKAKTGDRGHGTPQKRHVFVKSSTTWACTVTCKPEGDYFDKNSDAVSERWKRLSPNLALVAVMIKQADFAFNLISLTDVEPDLFGSAVEVMGFVFSRMEPVFEETTTQDESAVQSSGPRSHYVHKRYAMKGADKNARGNTAIVLLSHHIIVRSC